MTAPLVLDDIACVRGGRMLFEGLSLTLAQGEAALVTGANGVGKSSLLRIAAELLRPAAGHVAAARVALADGRAALDPELPLRRALAFWGASDAAVLDDFGLSALADVPVRLLSTGQRQRAALARVAMDDVANGGAALWLLDEPANGLDAAATAVLEHHVARHRDRGGAVMVATHIPVALPGAQVVAL
ncbi:ABC transporter ATP-binding protein [Sphingomonas sp.]|uniref:ABC transporter ATP-binding protein n=1 Tax=Sphingomonas sp. TaxID=28214 RepID=UPI0039C8C9E1